MVENSDRDYEVRVWLGQMLSSRKGRRRLAKKDGVLKDWKDIQEYYGPVNKPIDLGINKFKKMARERLENPYQYVVNYKVEMWNAFRNVKKESK